MRVRSAGVAPDERHTLADKPVDLLINGRSIARGEVVAVGAVIDAKRKEITDSGCGCHRGTGESGTSEDQACHASGTNLRGCDHGVSLLL